MKKTATPPPAIEIWPIERLKPYERNPRKNDGVVDKMVASIAEFGFKIPVLARSDGSVVDGHLRLKAAHKLNVRDVPVILCDEWTDAQVKAFRLLVNRSVGWAEWDTDLLGAELLELKGLDFDLDLTGFDKDEIETYTAPPAMVGLTDEDVIPEPPATPISRPGDLWHLGKHRVLCGDSTSIDSVQRLCGDGLPAVLLHADPPYGMGKQADGVLNDNIYRENLDRFQMQWWSSFRPFLAHNASVYIWGNAADLWRLWYVGGLGTSEKIELRNEIVWDKKSIAGMASPDLTQFPIASERCLFFQLGTQFIGNINADEFPETWEPLRSYLEFEAKTAGIRPGDIARICGCGMYSHWFTRSQFALIPEKHYRALAVAYPGRFARSWKEIKTEWDRVKGSGRDVINGRLVGMRSYFDNAHTIMRDVWEFPRVAGEDRHGHATPKPVAMMERVMLSSAPKGGICLEPFGGTGSTLMGAEKSGRTCYLMEQQPQYIDVCVTRWEEFTGKKATLERHAQ